MNTTWKNKEKKTYKESNKNNKQILGLFTPYQKKQPFLLFHYSTTADSSNDHYQGSRGYQNVRGRLETSIVHESLIVIGAYSCKDPHGHDCNTCGLGPRITKEFYN